MNQASEKIKLSSPEIAKRLIQLAIVFAAYCVAGKLGQATSSIRSGNLGPVWPAYGVAVAALLLCGYRVWPAIAAANFLIAYLGRTPAIEAAGQVAGSTFAAVAAVFLLRRFGFQIALARLKDALLLIVVGAFGSALISSGTGILVFYLTHTHAYSGLGPAWLVYWLGDSTGVLLVTPLILTFPNLLRIRSASGLEFIALLFFLTSASLVVFANLFPFHVNLDVLAFAVLPFVMWAAIRFGMSGATLAAFVIATIGTVETALGSGPFAHDTPFTNAVLLDVFFTVISVSGLALAAVIAEREHAQREHEQLVREQAAMEMRLRLATIVESSDDAIIAVDVNGNITDWNKGAEQSYGYSAEEAVGNSIFLIIPAEKANHCSAIMHEVIQGGVVRHHETTRRRKDATFVEVSLTASPVLGPAGRIIGMSRIERDITQRKRQEKIVRESEERFRLAAQAAKMFAYEWNAVTDEIVRSAESNQILGVDESTPLTGKQAIATVHPDDRQEVELALKRLSPQNPHLQVTYRIVRQDGKTIWVERHSVAHFDEQGKLLRIVGMVVDVTERKKSEEALAGARRKLIDAQEEERTRIARELHDDICQRLTLMTVELEQLQHSTPDVGELRNRVGELRNQLLEISSDVQSLSHELHSARLEFLGIGDATRAFCRELAEKQKVEINCEVHDLPGHVEKSVSLCLFRVLQEGLRNSLKHSGVNHFEVSLWATSDQVHLTVSDSGVGFDCKAARENGGLGLISMEERVRLLNGKFSLETQPNCGTTIQVHVPLISPKHRIRAAG